MKIWRLCLFLVLIGGRLESPHRSTRTWRARLRLFSFYRCTSLLRQVWKLFNCLRSSDFLHFRIFSCTNSTCAIKQVDGKTREAVRKRWRHRCFVQLYFEQSEKKIKLTETLNVWFINQEILKDWWGWSESGARGAVSAWLQVKSGQVSSAVFHHGRPHVGTLSTAPPRVVLPSVRPSVCPTTRVRYRGPRLPF